MHVVLLLGALILGFIVARLNLLSPEWDKRIDTVGRLALILLLFFMGLTLGSNSELTRSLPSLGLQALVLSLGTIWGSVFLVWGLTRGRRPEKCPIRSLVP
jgi:Kef-type K+ transport system membrane component KefB